jgi:hypothetical protein
MGQYDREAARGSEIFQGNPSHVFFLSPDGQELINITQADNVLYCWDIQPCLRTDQGVATNCNIFSIGFFVDQ